MHLPIRVGVSKTLGVRGIIADTVIKKGTIIERCPIVLIPTSQEKALFQTVLGRYYFEWTKQYHALVLGYGSLYNHSYSPNVRYDFNYKNRVMTYTAINDVEEGDELTINYNWEPDNTDPLDEILVDADTKYAFAAQ